MENDFILSCESTADIPYELFKERNIPVIFYKYSVDGELFEDNMGRSKDGLEIFYEKLKSGSIPKTSQINRFEYKSYFESLLNKGLPVLHIAFGSGLTPSLNNAFVAADEINELMGENKITVIDSLCGSSGYGMLVDMAYEYKKLGNGLLETAEYVMKKRHKINHLFFSSDMKFFKRSGRVSGVAATVAGVLGICPLMHLDKEGRMIANDKTRGRKNAVKCTIEDMIGKIKEGREYNGKCYISNAGCYEDAKYFKTEIEKTFPKLKGKVKIFDIGNIIASHCGKGTLAVFFEGVKR